MSIQNKSVLIVDDEKEIVDIFEGFLRKRNLVNIYKAYDGQEAFEIVETRKIDLIITDILMPHLNGIELARKVKNYCLGTKIIAITGGGKYIEKELLIDTSKSLKGILFSHVLAKPLKFYQIYDVIEEVLTKNF